MAIDLSVMSTSEVIPFLTLIMAPLKSSSSFLSGSGNITIATVTPLEMAFMSFSLILISLVLLQDIMISSLAPSILFLISFMITLSVSMSHRYGLELEFTVLVFCTIFFILPMLVLSSFTLMPRDASMSLALYIFFFPGLSSTIPFSFNLPRTS